MIVWKDVFAAGDLGWLMVTAVISVLLYLSGFVRVFLPQIMENGPSPNCESLPAHVAALTLAWCLWIFSFSFAPSAGTVPDVDPNPLPMMSLQRMMEVADAQPDETHLYGRGGVVGSTLFVGLQNTMPVIGEGKPNFPARRPNFHLPLLLEFVFRWSACLIVCVPLLVLWSVSLNGIRMFLLMAAWGTLVYAPVVHAVSGDGWLEEYGSLDFSIGLPLLASCCSGLFGRTGRQKTSGIALGVSEGTFSSPAGILMVWLGMSLHVSGYAFHADGRAVVALVNMLIGSSCGLLVWSFCNSFVWNRPMHSDSAAGVLTSLAAIIPGAGLMLPQSSLIVGCVIVACANLVFHASGRRNAVSMTNRLLLSVGTALFLGLLGTGVFATTGVAGYRWDGREIMGAVQGDTSQVLRQLIAAVVVMAWSAVISWTLVRIFSLFLRPDVTADR